MLIGVDSTRQQWGGCFCPMICSNIVGNVFIPLSSDFFFFYFWRCTCLIIFVLQFDEPCCITIPFTMRAVLTIHCFMLPSSFASSLSPLVCGRFSTTFLPGNFFLVTLFFFSYVPVICSIWSCYCASFAD